MPKQSAGVLLYRKRGRETGVFLVHPGGPYWANKDVAGWSLPKGEFTDGEEPLAAAKREFREETGQDLAGSFSPLGTIKQAGGKVVHAWAAEGECDPVKIVSTTFQIEWPPRSGKWATFPEVDRAAWFTLDEAAIKLHKGQVTFLDRLRVLLSKGTSGGE